MQGCRCRRCRRCRRARVVQGCRCRRLRRCRRVGVVRGCWRFCRRRSVRPGRSWPWRRRRPRVHPGRPSGRHRRPRRRGMPRHTPGASQLRPASTPRPKSNRPPAVRPSPTCRTRRASWHGCDRRPGASRVGCRRLVRAIGRRTIDSRRRTRRSCRSTVRRGDRTRTRSERIRGRRPPGPRPRDWQP